MITLLPEKNFQNLSFSSQFHLCSHLHFFVEATIWGGQCHHLFNDKNDSPWFYFDFYFLLLALLLLLLILLWLTFLILFLFVCYHYLFREGFIKKERRRKSFKKIVWGGHPTTPLVKLKMFSSSFFLFFLNEPFPYLIVFLVLAFINRYFFSLLLFSTFAHHLPNSSESLARLAAQNSSVEAIGAQGATFVVIIDNEIEEDSKYWRARRNLVIIHNEINEND